MQKQREETKLRNSGADDSDTDTFSESMRNPAPSDLGDYFDEHDTYVDDEEDIDEAKLPAPWETVLDDESGSYFYYNPETGETTWDFPGEDTAESPPAADSPTLPTGWREVYDDDSGGVFYYNDDTGESQWEVPT